MNSNRQKNLYEILIPISPNEGEDNIFICDSLGRFSEEYHNEFLETILNKAGGYTKCPNVDGAWKGDETTYLEQMMPIRIYADEHTMGELALLAKTRYSQEAIFVATLGTATLY